LEILRRFTPQNDIHKFGSGAAQPVHSTSRSLLV
jgi:hypothetical protein